MTQIVARVDDELAAALDELVGDGTVESRSDAVRQGLELLIDRRRRALVGERIVAGYQACPQGDDEGGWNDEATRRMIAEEPW
jgi:Arc/MetJ-type ribon-helix-helix transcriptional regulator